MNISKYTIQINSKIEDVIAKIKANGYRTVVILDGKKIMGVVSEGDILKAIINGADKKNLINKYVQINYKFLDKKDINEAASLIKKYNINLIPIVDKDMNLIDLITIGDVFENILTTNE